MQWTRQRQQPEQQMIVLSPYGIILNSSPPRDWLGQPFMRFVHNDDLILVCAGLSAACKQIMCPIRLRVRMALLVHQYFEWYELTIVECQKQQWVSVVVQREEGDNEESKSLSSWQEWMRHMAESGCVAIAHALVALVQLLQEHGYQLKSIRPEMTDRLLTLLEWAGLVNDTSTARSILNRLFDHCIAWYTAHVIKYTGPTRLYNVIL